MAYKNILVGLCGRGDEAVVISEAKQFADGRHITFIHVNDPHASKMSMMMDSPAPKFDEADVYNWVREVDEPLAKSSTITVLTNESIPKAISQASEGMDLLVLGHRKQSFFKENFFDSVDEGIVNQAACPVLVVPK